MPKLALTIESKTEYLEEADRESAMKRYWNACHAGDATAKLVLVENPPEPDPEPPTPPPAAPGAISPRAQLRIAEQEAWLTKAGFVMAPPLYAPGTRVLRLGDDNFRLERQRVENMPLFPDAANAIRGKIGNEVRQDVTLKLRDLAMTEDGGLVVNDAVVALETGAFFQLATLAGFGIGGRYLADCCSTKLRAENVNRQVELRKNRDVVLRTRLGAAGRRSVFATVTPTYAAVDTDQVLGAVTPYLTDAHTEMVYDGTGLKATALFMPDQVVDLAAGDIFKVGVRIETDDTGRGRIRVSGVAWRNRCLNLLIIGEGEVETVSAVHKGDPERILALVTDGVAKAREKVADFLGAWGYARTVKVDIQETLKAWVEDKKLGPISPKDRDKAVEELLSAWNHEPGDTLADAVSAVTRSAHESPWWPVNRRDELERRAASLVLVPR